MEGTRKFWMTVISIAALLIGMLIALAAGKLTEGMWTSWCVAVAGSGTAGVVANVVQKKIVPPSKEKKK